MLHPDRHSRRYFGRAQGEPIVRPGIRIIKPVLCTSEFYAKGVAAMSPVRAIQLMGVSAIGVLTGLACLNNLTDYNSNFALVQHVLSMDTTFAESTVRWRAITNAALHHAAYWLIIAAEGLAGVLCLAGAFKMLLVSGASAD